MGQNRNENSRAARSARTEENGYSKAARSARKEETGYNKAARSARTEETGYSKAARSVRTEENGYSKAERSNNSNKSKKNSGSNKLPADEYLKSRERDRRQEIPRKPRAVRSGGASPWQAVTEYLEKIRFKPRLFGGVDEADVWRKIEKLNELYEEALRAERVRYNALLEKRERKTAHSEGRAEDE